ncbi:uncharacterized protein Z520_02047 [Fonsecaea multimorphosa CBS 102226]|uniref:UBX domain-containing protein n=1 Tax=Fonsecaea multimorphosa CBS 102226 TaxID=1442371 RepID=A0A0D2KYN6_9EURO|nr:uncharacterized protein Z520_02047 [Fonsecaea multimorphosa CBS 102226]KIY01909.1 hypothetical protein Z520_02047 [Fonsecaea multimorphosa CBS 102226]
MFYDGDLSSAISTALQERKAVLCFVYDDSTEASKEWETILRDPSISPAVSSQTVAVLLNKGSEEAGFLDSICPITSTPAIIVIKDARVHENLQSADVSTERLKSRLASAFGIQQDGGATPQQSEREDEFTDSTPAHATPVESHQPMPSRPPQNPPVPVPAGEQVYATQNRAIPSPPHSSAPRRQAEPPVPSPVPSPAPADTLPSTGQSTEMSEKQKAQRSEYIKMQREREQKQRDERERIKAQIKADREERRLLDEMRKQGQTQETPASSSSTSSYARSRTSIANARAEVRVQVRTFDGSTLRNTFPPTSTITKEIRPWIDSSNSASSPPRTSGVPYNLKLILTPLPNRTIEAGEEDTELSDLGIVGSCTFVMVPVKGYVDSYASGGMGLGGGLLGGVVTGGYNLVSGTAGMVFGGVRSLLGYGSGGNAEQTMPTSGGGGSENASRQPPPGPGSGPGAGAAGNNVRIRTLADQRAEDAARRDQQFYNGNQLNFQPNNDEDHKRD